MKPSPNRITMGALPASASALGMILFILLLNKAIVNAPGLGQGTEADFPYHRYVTVAGILFCLSFPRVTWELVKQKWLYLLYVFYVALSITWAQSAADAFQTTRYFVAAFVGTLCAAIATRGDLRVFLYWMLPYLLLVLGASIALCKMYPWTYIELQSGRWQGITAHPNALGAAALATVWTSLGVIALSKSVIYRIMALAGLLAASICFKGTDSMTSTLTAGTVAFIVAYLLFVTKLSRGPKAFLITAALISFIVVGVLFVVWPEALPIQRAFDLAGRDRSFTGRTKLWGIALDLFRAKPVFGWGFDQLHNVEINYGIQLRHLHNGYLDLLVRGGIIGMGMLLAMTIILVARILRALNNSRTLGSVLAAGLAMVLIHNIAEGSFGRGMNTLWLFYSFLFFYSPAWRDEMKSDRPAAAPIRFQNLLR